MHRKPVFELLIILLVTALVISLMAGAAEALIRYRQAQKSGGIYTIEDLYVTDPVLNLRIPRPGKTTSTIRIDSRGFRNEELPMPKPVGLLRIAYLGASTTFCAEVSGNEKTWPHMTTGLLRKTFPGVPMDYINAGVPGYVVETSLRHLRTLVSPLEPDVIVIYHATNDLSGEMRELAVQQGIYRTDDIKESWLAKRSVLWNLMEKNLRIILAKTDAKAQRGRLEFAADNIGKKFENDFTDLIREAQKVAPLVAVATFSTQIRPEQTPERKLDAASSSLYYMPFMSPDGLILAFNRYNEIIRRVASDTGALLVESANQIPGDSDHFNDSVHFKDAGSQKLAELIAPALSRSETFLAIVDQARRARQ